MSLNSTDTKEIRKFGLGPDFFRLLVCLGSLAEKACAHLSWRCVVNAWAWLYFSPCSLKTCLQYLA